MVEDSCFDELDRGFFNLAAKLSDSFCWTYGRLGYRLVAPLTPNQFDNAATKTKEIGVRALIVLGALVGFCLAGTYHFLIVAAILGGGSKICRAAGFYFQKEGFTHIRGKAPESPLVQGQATVMVWSIRGYGNGLYYPYGVVHWQSRVDAIALQILKEDPDVVVLKDVFDAGLVEALVDRLGIHFAHFYTHIGADAYGGENGLMVLTKCAVHKFTHADFRQNESKITRGFEMVEIKASPSDKGPCARIVTTQLAQEKQAGEMRMAQMAQIIQAIARKKLPLPTLFVGGVQKDRMGEEWGEFSKYLYHSYQGPTPTHPGILMSQWAPIYDGEVEITDVISLVRRSSLDGKILPVVEKGIALIDSHLVLGFESDTKTARSDSHAVVTTVSGLEK